MGFDDPHTCADKEVMVTYHRAICMSRLIFTYWARSSYYVSMSNTTTHPTDYERFGIDGRLTEDILSTINAAGATSATETAEACIPDADDPNIFDMTMFSQISCDFQRTKEILSELVLDLDITRYGIQEGDSISFDREGLERIGLRLLPKLSYGILNGGSATSYIDRSKNLDYAPALFPLIEEPYQKLSSQCEGKAKALTPAYLNPDGTPGYTFIELKLRALLVLALRYMRETGDPTGIPVFQMVSGFTGPQLLVSGLLDPTSPLFSDLIDITGFDITRIISRTQPLIAAYTHIEEGLPRRVFDRAWGTPDTLLPLPGGHGQNFYILQDVYRGLLQSGRRFAYLVNIDNLGNLPDLVQLALMAITGSDSAFEFIPKTPVDTKGGVLVKNEDGSYTCKDLGVAISKSEVEEAERSGKRVLFNCATGLFDLEGLDSLLPRIISSLPIRVSEQRKDSGSYAQAEQVTWEVIPLMQSPLFFSVEKSKRFLAAKLLSESILTSRAGVLADTLLDRDPTLSTFVKTSLALNKGLDDLLSGTYGLQLIDGSWQPLAAKDII